MYNYNQHLHFIGIGGVGMAGIAEVLLNLNYSVGGSDAKYGPLIQHLENLGAKVHIGHRIENIPPHTSVVVISSAIEEDNPELVEARSRGIPVIPRAEMLSELMRMKYGIAVAGSHGKTTTTSMTAKILRDSGFDPTVIVGGRVLSQPTGANVGTGEYLVAEADESDGSFCLLRPAIAVVTNIDAEHLGHYGSFGALETAFGQFMNYVPFYGLVIACFDDPVVARIASSLKRRVVSFGLSPEHDFGASDIRVFRGGSEYTLHINGQSIERVKLPMLGSHMVSNSLAAIAVATELGAYPQEAAQALASFPGVARRTEVLFDDGQFAVIDDYAHHPREITATLQAIKRGWLGGETRERGRLLTIFQPHRFSRTKELFAEFLNCFRDADELVLGEIYPAGEKPIPGISGEALAAAIQHPQVSYSPDLQECIPNILANIAPGDVIVTIGAGSITNIGHRLATELKGHARSANA